MSAPSRAGAFATAATGVFMATLDGSIVNVALPTLSRDFAAPVESVQWVVIAYLLAATATLLSFGRLSDVVGRRAAYAGGLVVFALGSAACAAATSVSVLVGARVAQGLGGSALMANGPALVTGAFPAHQRGRALGLIGAVVSLGLISGPSLGGLILSVASWRWIFLVNLPVAAAGVALAFRSVPAQGARGARFDLGASLLLTFGVALVLLALSRHGAPAGRGALLGGGAAALLAWFVRERRSAHPVVDLALLTRGPFARASSAALLAFAGLFCPYVLVPFYLAGAAALSEARLGLSLTAVPLGMALASPLSGLFVDRRGPRLPAALGAAGMGLSMAALGLAGPAPTLHAVELTLFALGAGAGFFASANSTALMGAAPPERLGAAGGMLAMARNGGMALGAAVGTGVFTARYHALTAGTYAHGAPGDPTALAAAFAAAAWIGAALAALTTVLVASPPARGRTAAP